MAANRVKQNFHSESEAAINKQINMELYASYVYQALAYQFDRHDVALKGFYKFFKDNSDEEREHAEKFMKYLNDRGGDIELEPIAKPTNYKVKSGIEAMRMALQLERDVNDSLLKLHKVASRLEDAHLSDFLEEEFLDEQVQAIKKLGDFITNLERVDADKVAGDKAGSCGAGLGEYLFDKLTLQSS